MQQRSACSDATLTADRCFEQGSAVEVSWTIEANHAGGYQYRLAPRTPAPLTEAEFQKTPLAFVGKQGLRWRGGTKNGGTEIWFNATYVTQGTKPAGSAWAKNPVRPHPSHRLTASDAFLWLSPDPAGHG